MSEKDLSFGQDPQQDWVTTRRLHNVHAYRRFLAAHPDHAFAAEAREALHALKEDKDWYKATRRDRLFSYETYLSTYPNGRYATEAGQRIEVLEHEMAWEEAKRSNSVAAYLRYKSQYPEGKFVSEAVERILNLVRQQPGTKETESWEQDPDLAPEEAALETATNEDSVAAYNAFLKQFPQGKYARQVRQRIAQLEHKLAKQYRQLEEELLAWQYADEQDSLLSYRDFLRRFPEGRFAELARKRLEAHARKVQARVSQHARPYEAEEPHSSPLKVRPPELSADAERDQAGFFLALIWAGGFGVVSLMAHFLAPFLYPISLFIGLSIGGYFVRNRGLRLRLREVVVYLLVLPGGSFFLVWALFEQETDPPALPYLLAATATLTVLLLLIHHYLRIRQRQKSG